MSFNDFETVETGDERDDTEPTIIEQIEEKLSTHINEQLEALLSAASVPATIVNWGGDEVVTLQEWAEYFGELSGLPVNLDVHVVEGSHRGNISDASNRRSLTGPCKTSWRDGMRWVFEERPLTN